MDTIAERIKEIRKEYGLSQEAFGNRLSVSQDTVSLWERGISAPSVETVIEICKLFHVSADYLLGLTEY